jgi:hypothetical protein
VYEALNELSRYEAEQGDIDIETSSEPSSSATITADQSVGGQFSLFE